MHPRDSNMNLTQHPEPRGDDRILYASDTNNIGMCILRSSPHRAVYFESPQPGDEPTAADLRRHLDDLADNGVDIFAQCVLAKQGVGWFKPEHPDHAPRRSIVDAIDPADGLPIEIAIDQCHKRDMKFIAKFRMADRHTPQDSREAVPRGFAERRAFWIPQFGHGALDFTHDEVCDWFFVMVEEILRRFDVDGFEFNYIRHMHCFPTDTARESHSVMTGFIRRVREKLDEAAAKMGQPLWLGVRVPQTMEECTALGYGVATWVHQKLVDYVAPCDFFYSDFNAKYEQFSDLTRDTECLLFPTMAPVLSWLDMSRLMTPENYRAAAKNMYAAGADGISVFNPQYMWSRRAPVEARHPGPPSGYLPALAWLRQMRYPATYNHLPRHYLFHPHWPVAYPSPSGFAKHDRIVLKRTVGAGGEYRFRIAEDLGAPKVRAELIVTASSSADGDVFEFSLNGAPVPSNWIKTAWNFEGRLDRYGRPLEPHYTFMIRLEAPPARFGDNLLGVMIAGLDDEAEQDIVIDELEVTVLPPDNLQHQDDKHVLYASDNNNIGWYLLRCSPHRLDNAEGAMPADRGLVTAADLRRHLDDLADNGVDIFAQCVLAKQGAGWFEPEHPDHAHRPAIVDAIDPADGPPIQIAIDQCHNRGMKFIAKFRMADRHTPQDGPDAIPRGFADQKTFWIPEFGQGALDFTHQEVRDWFFAMVEEILRRFDVDGFEFNYIRHMHCFPTDMAGRSHPIMTRFIRRVRRKLDEAASMNGRALWLGVRVPQTLEECTALGYDVATWTREGLVDYVCPCDFFYTDFNAPYEQFAELVRSTSCMLLPTVHPVLSWVDESRLMRPENYRAAVANIVAAGAHGVSIFNPMYHWVRRATSEARHQGPPSVYPTALAWLRQMRDPADYEHMPRHYLFHPLWPVSHPSPSGFTKHDRIVLKRQAGNFGEYRFRVAEDLGAPGVQAELIVTASTSAQGDRFEFSLNGTRVPSDSIKTTWNHEGRLDRYGRPLQPHYTFMFRIESLPVQNGVSVLGVKVIELDEAADEHIVIDELEVTVLPPMR